MNKEERFDKIEAYILGALTDQEKADFEQAIETDKELASELQLQQMEHEAMRILERNHLKAQFADWAVEKQQEQTTTKTVQMRTNRRPMRNRLAIAASFLVLVVAGFMVQTNYSSNALANEFMLPTNFGDRGNMGDANPLDEAFQAMENDDYQTAFNILDNLKNTAYADEALLYKAKAQYLNKDYAAAITTYQEMIASSSSSVNVQNAERGLVAAMLKQGKTEEAKALLTSMAENDQHTHQEEAQKLLEKQNSLWGRIAF